MITQRKHCARPRCCCWLLSVHAAACLNALTHLRAGRARCNKVKRAYGERKIYCSRAGGETLINGRANWRGSQLQSRIISLPQETRTQPAFTPRANPLVARSKTPLLRTKQQHRTCTPRADYQVRKCAFSHLKLGGSPAGWMVLLFLRILHTHTTNFPSSASEMGGHAVSFNHLNADAHRGAAGVGVFSISHFRARNSRSYLDFPQQRTDN
jgi:hypothetical protein